MTDPTADRARLRELAMELTALIECDFRDIPSQPDKFPMAAKVLPLARGVIALTEPVTPAKPSPDWNHICGERDRFCSHCGRPILWA